MAYLPNKKMQSMIIIIMIIEPTDFETNPSSSVMHPNLKSTEWTHLNAGWWLTYPSEIKSSSVGIFFPIYGKIKYVPNHYQPEWILTWGSGVG